MIPYGRQEITKEDILEVEKVLRSDFLTQGPIVPKFEQKVADSDIFVRAVVRTLSDRLRKAQKLR